jgi:hypothetical protein
MPWKLKRTRQCSKCPWRTDVNPRDIPGGYDEARHRALGTTIARPADLTTLGGPLYIMACHEENTAHCVGWLANQMGPGNNIPLRLSLLSCENAGRVRTVGAQHATLEETFPREPEAP